MNLNRLKGNIFGGITAGVIALPLALAFGIASGLGAVSGLYGAIILCFFASLIGGTPTQISGPTGPMTVVIASMVANHPNNLNLVFFTIFLAGIFQIILGFCKVGKFVQYLPYPVISGFMSGIGVIILLLQVNQFLGLDYSGHPALSLINVAKNFGHINPLCPILGIAVLLIIIFTPKKLRNYFPPTLLALLIITVLSIVLGLDVPTIGTIPQSLPSIKLGMINFQEFRIVLPIAMTLAVLGSIDSLLTSVVADSLTKTKHKSNKELIGQGLGNLVTSLFGGLAGAGATMRTVVNIKSGGTTKLSGIIHSIFLILVVIFFGSFVSKIPLAVLAAILFKVGFDIIDYKFLKIIKHAPKSDIFVMIAVFLITVFDDLIFAVGIGVVLSSVLFVARSAQDTKLKMNATDDYFEETDNDKAIILHVNGNLFFGSSSFLLSQLQTLKQYETVIIDLRNAINIDISAVFAIEDMIIRMKEQGIETLIVFEDRKTASKLLRLGLRHIISKENIKFSL